MIKKNKVFLAMIILLLALLCIGWEISLPYRTPVLVIGTQEIFSDEWQEFLQQQKSAVTVYYTQNYGCTVFDDAFWSTEYDGQTPLDCARNRALDTLIDNCVVLRAAQERDLIENIDLRTLKKEWKGFNKQRESSVSMNSVMYGPIEYSFENYYRHLISNLRNSLEENLIDEDPLIEEAAQEFYGENLNQFTTSGNTHVSGLLVEGSHASAYQLIQEAQRAIREGMSFENACTRYATSGEEERFQFTSLSQKADIHGLSTIYAACSQLEIGEISEIIETQQGYYLLKITEKDKEQVMAYEEVKNRIRDILATEKLEYYEKNAIWSAFATDSIDIVHTVFNRFCRRRCSYKRDRLLCRCRGWR